MLATKLARCRKAIDQAKSTDELTDIERRFGPFDENDPDTFELLFEMCAAACLLSRGPAPSRDRFALARRAPLSARIRFRVSGRIGERITTVVWADGRLYGSLYAIARLEARPFDWRDATLAFEQIRAAFDHIHDTDARAA
jgi:hypothetical protein